MTGEDKDMQLMDIINCPPEQYIVAEKAEYMAKLAESVEGYSGKLSLRVPRSLHKELAERAKLEGVSLNQYALYKLSH